VIVTAISISKLSTEYEKNNKTFAAYLYHQLYVTNDFVSHCDQQAKYRQQNKAQIQKLSDDSFLFSSLHLLLAFNISIHTWKFYQHDILTGY